ncbi:Mu transposase C-terminal domain-containing protein [Shewanella glacialipiscicola]|uniref:Mu transposase C-terminal domain-containing protein n=1 Tax=Shewanella glacialipiscicola TaxID=614069 RepID=UPI0021D82D0A|nr:Mu transposase C-terminal domain-containing protein [Shewanella glacialipiscicola]MCU7995270.1 Mu transposase C-terminal domain-containing protein [Shewanella glacialipiscicola]MCU8026613.1 Mu transposase C-terminal domain-containing protein [Shewanella glacialipiscicola]
MSESLSLDRRLLDIKIGAVVMVNGKSYRVDNIISFSEVLGVDMDTKRPKLLNIDELELAPTEYRGSTQLSLDDSEISDEYWQIALERFALIKPIIESSTKADVEAIAKASGNHFTTVYNWLKLYRAQKSILSLVPRKRGWRESKTRLDLQSETILRKVIEDFYLTAQKPSISKVITLVVIQCTKLGITPPHANTIRNRINSISSYQRLKAHGEKDKVRDKYSPASMSFPGADAPLMYVQIDHTPLDIIIVDDEYRLPIGRAYLTLAIDVFSRVIVGYYLSLDAPSAISVGMCLTCSILPKNKLLLDLDINATWDVWGVMNTIHTDNGADFRTDYLSRTCLKYNINWEFRPIGGANFGGHIERLLGTINRELHTVPGATFSNIQQRGSYDSEEQSVMTFRELERYVVTWITKVYHHSKHSSIGMSPIKKWEEGIWGTSKSPGTGLRPKVADSQTLLIDFLPEFSRTVQRYGIEIDKLFYYGDVLRRWIGAEETGNSKRKKKFICKRDPRDVSTIWFYDPETKMYFRLPTAKQEIPAISIWEYTQVQKYMAESGKNCTDQNAIYDAILELREQIKTSSKITKKTRRAAQRQRLHQTTSIKNTNVVINKNVAIHTEEHTESFWNEPVSGYIDVR